MNYRIIINRPFEKEINLLLIYDKAERDNITLGEIKALLKDIGLDNT